jgi:radical SAM superfamily enzyme YgiQ (UPF0313 family)
MKVTYIYPHLFANSYAADAMQPLAIAGLAAQTPDSWEMEFFDDRLEPIEFDRPTDLVVISTITYTAKRAYNIASMYRRLSVPVILGGFHPTLRPDEALEYCDSVVTGDLELIWSQVLKDAEQGRLKPRYDAGICRDAERICFDRTIFKGKKYAPMIPVQMNRGCRYSCDFCSIHSFYGSEILSRKIDSMIAEIESIPQKFLMFVDDNIFVNDEVIFPLLDELARLKSSKKKWSCQISIDAAHNPKLLRKLHDAGCTAVLVGFESMDHENIRSMGKGGNLRYRNYTEAVKGFKDAGLMVCGAFVFGYDGDGEESIWRTLDFALEQKFALCHFNTLIPFPETRVFDKLKKEGRLLHDRWWIEPELRYGDPLFTPKNITAGRLYELCFQARKQFNSYSNIARRAMDRKSNASTPFQLFSYLLSNFISRREIYKKQGEVLG